MPLWDRFDMCIKTEEIGYEQLGDKNHGDTLDSSYMKQAVDRARAAQIKRFNGRILCTIHRWVERRLRNSVDLEKRKNS